MEVIHSGLLFLLPLAAVPVILHLLSLHRLKTVELSTFRFLFDSFVQQRRKMRLLEALLAALRALFLLLLVFALARPVATHWAKLFGSGSAREVLLLVDCSASMNARTGGVSSFDRAKAAVRKIVERLEPDDRLTLYRVTARTEEVFSRFSADTASIEDRIDSLKLSPSRANFLAAFVQAFGPEHADRARPLVYLVTDCQAGSWRELSQQTVENLFPEKAQLIVVNVASQKEIANVGLVGNPPPRERVTVGLPLRLLARATNYCKSQPADVTLSLFIDDKEVARAPLRMKAGQPVEHEFIYVPSEAGVLRGRFEITADRFPDDDRYLFVLSVAPQIKVLLVNGNPAANPFENEALYLRTALTSTATRDQPAAGAASMTKQLQQSLQLVEIAEPALSAESLRDVSVVILANCGRLHGQQFAAIQNYVRDGGGLMIFPGARVNPDAYNAQFFHLPGPAKQKFMAVTLGAAQGDVQKVDDFRRLELIDYTHPALRVFDEPKARYFATAAFYRRFALLPDASSDAVWPLAGYSAKEPALLEARCGDGLILLAGFPATGEWSSLPLKPEFVPLVLRMVSYVGRRAELDTPSVTPPDGVAEIVVAAAWNPVTATVTDPAGHPSDVAFQPVGTRLVGGFEQTTLPGYYRVEVKGDKPGEPKSGTSALAVNIAPEESRLAAAGEEDIRRWLPGVSLRVVDASAEAQQQFGSVGEGTEIWRYLLLITFVVIAVEFMLSTLSGRPADGRDNRWNWRRLWHRLHPGDWTEEARP
jgi:hypothetical protein